MKNIIYNRVSTEEQNPENQLKDCVSICKGEYELIEDKESAWKDKKREGFENLIKLIKSKQVNNLIVWDLDRLYRNRAKLLNFFRLCQTYNCSILSFRQKFLTEIQEITLPQGFEFIKEMMINNFLQFLGWIAEDESIKKSERIKIAVRKICPKCEKTNQGSSKTCENCGYNLIRVKARSYKGNKWGRKRIRKKYKEQVIKLHQEGKSYDEIKELVFYWNKGNKKFISKGMISKIINSQK